MELILQATLDERFNGGDTGRSTGSSAAPSALNAAFYRRDARQDGPLALLQGSQSCGIYGVARPFHAQQIYTGF
jgi:hypothetical protein